MKGRSGRGAERSKWITPQSVDCIITFAFISYIPFKSLSITLVEIPIPHSRGIEVIGSASTRGDGSDVGVIERVGAPSYGNRAVGGAETGGECHLHLYYLG